MNPAECVGYLDGCSHSQTFASNHGVLSIASSGSEASPADLQWVRHQVVAGVGKLPIPISNLELVEGTNAAS